MGSEKINIRRAKEEDRRDVLNLLNKVFAENQRSSTQRDDDYWQWKFKTNVFGESILYIAETESKIVGFDHLWPWELRYRGTTINAYQPCDSAVASSYRGRGVFKRLRLEGIKEAKKRKSSLLFNFPNSNSLSVNIRHGAQQLGRITWWVRVLEPLNVVSWRFSKELSLPSDIDKKFRLDIDKLDKLSKTDAVFDRFISINRKVGFYEWRYQNKPDREYGMISIEQGSKMIGAIFTMNQKGVSREMVLVDIVGDSILSDTLFKKLVKVAKLLDATFLALMDNPKFKTDQLWKNGFIKKRMKNMVVLPFNSSIESKAIKFTNWSLVAGIHDSI